MRQLLVALSILSAISSAAPVFAGTGHDVPVGYNSGRWFAGKVQKFADKWKAKRDFKQFVRENGLTKEYRAIKSEHRVGTTRALGAIYTGITGSALVLQILGSMKAGPFGYFAEAVTGYQGFAYLKEASRLTKFARWELLNTAKEKGIAVDAARKKIWTENGILAK